MRLRSSGRKQADSTRIWRGKLTGCIPSLARLSVQNAFLSGSFFIFLVSTLLLMLLPCPPSHSAPRRFVVGFPSATVLQPRAAFPLPFPPDGRIRGEGGEAAAAVTPLSPFFSSFAFWWVWSLGWVAPPSSSFLPSQLPLPRLDGGWVGRGTAGKGGGGGSCSLFDLSSPSPFPLQAPGLPRPVLSSPFAPSTTSPLLFLLFPPSLAIPQE